MQQPLSDAVASLTPSLTDLAHALHADPETAFGEVRAAGRIKDLLQREGIKASVGVHGLATALRAEFTAGTGGRTIGILAEYDALPEIGHACGHNVIAAAGVGAFLALHRTRDTLNGRVVLLGTPAEEGHTGKEYLARNNAFDGLDAAIMVHPYAHDLADHVWLGRRTARLTFTGVAAHASSEPEKGRNALDAATLFYTGIGLFRQQMTPGDRVHAVIADGGTRASIIPETAVVDLYVRSPEIDGLLALSERVADIAHGAALMAGVTHDLAWDAHPASLPVRTNRPMTERWAAAQATRGRQALPLGSVPASTAASTDFGNVSVRVPGIHPLIAIAPTGTALHTRAFAEAAASPAAEQAIADAAFGLASVARDFLTDDDLAAAVRADFEASGGVLDVGALFDR